VIFYRNLKEDLAKYLVSKNLEEHLSNIIQIVGKHYNTKLVPSLPKKTPVKRKNSKEALFENHL